MRYFICIISVSVLFSCRNEEKAFVKAPLVPSKIDSLTDDSDIEEFIHSIDTNYKYFKLKSVEEFDNQDERDSLIKIIAKKENINKLFYKEDLDNNGYIDLLAVGDKYNGHLYSEYFSIIVLMNFGKDSIKILNAIRNNRDTPLSIPKVIYKAGKPLLEILECDDYNWEAKKYNKLRTNVLTYKFGQLVEYNAKAVDQRVEKIEFATGPCHGNCPVFQMTINKDKSAYFIARYDNFSQIDITSDLPIEEIIKEEGFFKTKIHEGDYNKLMEILNYIEIDNLRDYYTLDLLGPSTGKLVIIYKGGKIKTIIDQGYIGTYALKQIYSLLFNFRFNQNWQPAQEPDGIRLPESKKITMEDIQKELGN